MRKILRGKKNAKLQVKAEDLPGLVRMWLAGLPLDEMFLSLPALARSTKSPKVSVWAEGIDEPTVWDDDFDKFCDVIKQVFRDYVPWLMFACKQLSEVAQGWSETVPWDVYSSYYDAGVDSVWAVQLLNTDAPVERRAAATIGRKIPESWITEADPLGLKGIHKQESRRLQFDSLIEDCIKEAGGEETGAGAELRTLCDVILQRSGISEAVGTNVPRGGFIRSVTVEHSGEKTNQPRASDLTSAAADESPRSVLTKRRLGRNAVFMELRRLSTVQLYALFQMARAELTREELAMIHEIVRERPEDVNAVALLADLASVLYSDL